MSLPRKKQTARISCVSPRRGFSILITLPRRLAVLCFVFVSTHQGAGEPPVPNVFTDFKPDPNRHQLAVKPTEAGVNLSQARARRRRFNRGNTRARETLKKGSLMFLFSLDKGRSGVGAATQSPYANDLVLNLSKPFQDTWANA